MECEGADFLQTPDQPKRLREVGEIADSLCLDEHIRRYAELLATRQSTEAKPQQIAAVCESKGGRGNKGIPRQIAEEGGIRGVAPGDGARRNRQRSREESPSWRLYFRPLHRRHRDQNRRKRTVGVSQQSAPKPKIGQAVRFCVNLSRNLFRHRHADAARLVREVGASFDQRHAHGIDRGRGNRLTRLKPRAGYARYARLLGEVGEGPLQRSARHA